MSFKENHTELNANIEAEEPKIDQVGQKFLSDLQEEQSRLADNFPICALLIEEAFDRFYSTGLKPGDESNADVLNQKPIVFIQKFVVPADECPKLNLVYKLLESKESFLIPLQTETECKIIIKGRSSMRDTEKEEALRQSGDPLHNHLNKDLFLEISTVATPLECYARMTNALQEIRKYLKPENKNGSDEEFQEIMEIRTEEVSNPDLKHESDPFAKDPLLEAGFKETNLPALVLNKPQGFQNKPLIINVANKLIKLLDETVLNPNFQYTKEAATMVSNNIDVLNNCIATKAPKIVQEINMENDLVTEPSPKDTSVKLGLSNRREVKRKPSKDSTNFKIKSKKENTKSIKKRMIHKKLTIKEKYPGLFYLKDRKSNKIKKHLILSKTTLSRCLKRTHKEHIQPEENDNYQPFTIEYIQQNPSELVFEHTPRDTMMSLLESMKSYPVLWEFHDKPFNEDYNKAIEELCELVKVEWSLSIDFLKMRRSITRILRFYRYLFPFEVIEQFTDYFEKCAGFLPAAAVSIPHARCSHCLLCYKEDFELKKHLNEEHTLLKWTYKCKHCGEIFNESKEYEFHKRLPHFLEIFTCSYCNERFNNLLSLNRHLTSHQIIVMEEPRKYVCDVCGKGFKSRGVLRGHKYYHAEKKFACHLCPKSYYRQTTLTLHLKAHRKQLDVICEVCGKGFVQQSKLREHMEKHTDVKVSCNICQLQIRKRNLYRHLRTVHLAIEGTIEDTYRAKRHHYNKGKLQRISLQDLPKQFVSTKKRSKRAGECAPRQYDCKTCYIQFDRLKFLKDHNRQFHSDGPKLACKICGSELSQKQNLKRHYREKHKLQEFQIFGIVEQDREINEVMAIKLEVSEEMREQKIV